MRKGCTGDLSTSHGQFLLVKNDDEVVCCPKLFFVKAIKTTLAFSSLDACFQWTQWRWFQPSFLGAPQNPRLMGLEQTCFFRRSKRFRHGGMIVTIGWVKSSHSISFPTWWKALGSPLGICYYGKWSIFIVDLPTEDGEDGDLSSSQTLSLPEGKPPCSYGFPMVFPMVFPWFSHGFPQS